MTAYQLAEKIAAFDFDNTPDPLLQKAFLVICTEEAREIVESQTKDAELVARYREFAKAAASVEGQLEIDDDAQVSIGDDEQGAYVQAWYWVDRSDIDDEDDEDED